MEHVSLRVSYVQDAEKLQRITLVADSDSLKENKDAVESIMAAPTDTIVASVKCVDADGKSVQPVQSVLRISDESSYPPLDSVWPLTTRRNELRREVALPQEIRADNEFWKPNTPYTVQIVVGDARLDTSIVWTATRSLLFNSSEAFERLSKKRGVFDFDLSVRKTLQPEFDTPLPPKVKEAPLPIVLAFSILSVVPLFALLFVWNRMGAFSLQLPSKAGQRFSLFMFELCLLGHTGALVMFWVQWNIVTTWKAMGVLMVPTLIFGHSALGDAATKQYFNKRRSDTKTE